MASGPAGSGAKLSGQNYEEGNRYDGDDGVDAAKFGGGEDDERNKNRDEENPRTIARVNAIDDLGHDRNVAPLRIADQCDGKTGNPSRPAVENIEWLMILILGAT